MSADLRALATKEMCVQVSCGQTYSALLFESGEVRARSPSFSPSLAANPVPCRSPCRSARSQSKVYNSGRLTSLPALLENEDESPVVINKPRLSYRHGSRGTGGRALKQVHCSSRLLLPPLRPRSSLLNLTLHIHPPPPYLSRSPVLMTTSLRC